ncbi:hypothetical protein T06_16445 [Trichinella sp. T6]|nr:hypothetical protein T06_16445 [Trichinella sp. T6]
MPEEAVIITKNNQKYICLLQIPAYSEQDDPEREEERHSTLPNATFSTTFRCNRVNLRKRSPYKLEMVSNLAKSVMH